VPDRYFYWEGSRSEPGQDELSSLGSTEEGVRRGRRAEVLPSIEYVFGLRKSYLNQTQMLDANILVPAILFVLLTPGLLLALPSGQSLFVQSVVHAIVFAIIYWGLRQVFPQYY
jgi:hypothetical protein